MTSNLLPRLFLVLLTAGLFSSIISGAAAGQTVTIVGTQHLRGLETPPTKEQFDHSISALSAFAPTQVCVERMSGARIQSLAQDPMRNAMTFNPETHGRPLSNVIIPLGVEMQARLGVLPADARDEASRLAARWDDINLSDRLRLIAVQIAGYEFHSAVLNWSYLDTKDQSVAAEGILAPAAETLDDFAASNHEVYALAVPIARRAGLHELCTADSLEYETAGMQAALKSGGEAILEAEEVRARFEDYSEALASRWRPESGPAALTQMLAYMNSDEFADFDLENQWELLRRNDNDAGAFRRRLMFWHARTAQISSELYRALAQGPEERVLLIIGAAHRPFNEAEMRAQPWVTVAPASALLDQALE